MVERIDRWRAANGTFHDTKEAAELEDQVRDLHQRIIRAAGYDDMDEEGWPPGHVRNTQDASLPTLYAIARNSPSLFKRLLSALPTETPND